MNRWLVHGTGGVNLRGELQCPTVLGPRTGCRFGGGARLILRYRPGIEPAFQNRAVQGAFVHVLA